MASNAIMSFAKIVIANFRPSVIQVLMNANNIAIPINGRKGLKSERNIIIVCIFSIYSSPSSSSPSIQSALTL